MKIECDYKIFVFYEDSHNEIACIFWFVNLGKVKMNFLFDFFFFLESVNVKLLDCL